MKKLFIILLFFIACSPKIKKREPLDLYDAIEVKASGGFTGVSTGYLIQKNAEIYLIYHKAGKPYNQKFYRQSTIDSVNEIFSQLAASKILTKPYSKPGNLTYSISARKDSIDNSINWSDGQDSIQNYIKMYHVLRNFASGKK